MLTERGVHMSNCIMFYPHTLPSSIPALPANRRTLPRIYFTPLTTPLPITFQPPIFYLLLVTFAYLLLSHLFSDLSDSSTRVLRLAPCALSPCFRSSLCFVPPPPHISSAPGRRDVTSFPGCQTDSNNLFILQNCSDPLLGIQNFHDLSMKSETN